MISSGFETYSKFDISNQIQILLYVLESQYIIMNRRRSKEQISFKILEICRGGGAAKTRIVYACNLNFRVTNHYLEGLVNSGFLEIVDGSVTLYKTTNKGLAFLERLRPIEALITANGSEE